MANKNEELRQEDFKKAAGDAKAKAAEFRQQTVDGANSLRQQAADGLGSLQETLKGKGDTGSSTAEAVRNKGAELVGAGKDKVEPSVADKAKSTLKSVKETVLPTAHAGTLTAEEQRQQAREHLHKASDDTAKAGQHAASAAQTVAANAQATGDVAADKAEQAKGAAREGVDQAKDEAKTLYESAKDTLSGWLGSKDRAVAETKDSVDRAVEGTQDAISRNANKASAKVQGAFRDTEASARSTADRAASKVPSSDDVERGARSAVNSVEDAAIRTKESAVDAARYVKDRLTAPVAGESHETGTAGQRARDGADKLQAHGQGLADRAREGYEDAKHSASRAYEDTKHSASRAYEDTKHRVLDTAEEAKQRARDAAERARPRTLEEAEKAEGLPPSNTASLRKSRLQAHDKVGRSRGEAPVGAQLEDATHGAMQSAADMAAQAKDGVYGAAQYVKDRLTAPVGGEAHDTRGTVDSAKHDMRGTANKAGDYGRGLVDQARDAVGDAGDYGRGLVDQARDAVGDAKARLTQAAEDAARSAQEAADSVRPHTIEEAELAQGLPPSNTADILAERAALARARSGPSTDSLASKVANAWGGEQLSGDSDLASVREGLNRRR